MGKHPGRQTEYAKFTSAMRKLQNRLDEEKARIAKEKAERMKKKAKEKEDNQKGE